MLEESDLLPCSTYSVVLTGALRIGYVYRPHVTIGWSQQFIPW